MADHSYPLLFTLIQVIFTYGIAPIVVYQIISKLIIGVTNNKGFILASSFGMAPVCISWLITMSFLAFPGYPSWYYIAFINTIFLILFILLRQQLLTLPNLIRNIGNEISHTIKTDFTTSLIVLSGIGLVIIAFFLSAFLPYSENDALEYAMLAKIMFKSSSAQMYPIFDGTPYGGFIAPFTHPLGYSSLYVWSYLIKGSAETFGLIRIVAPYYGLCTYVLILVMLFKINKRWAAFAALFYIATPLFYSGIIRHQIETIRLFTFFNLFMFLPILYMLTKWRSIILGGLLVGMCLYCHSFSVLSIPIFAFVYWVCANESFITRAYKITLIISIGILLVLPRYIINFHVTGHFIQDGTIVRSVSQLNFKEVYEVTHSIYSFNLKWINGFFKLFYSVIDFGITYFSLLISLFFITPKKIKSFFYTKLSGDNKVYSPLIISCLVLLCFLGMITLSILIGDNNFIASSRYMMSMQPFVAIVAGWTTVILLRRIPSKTTVTSLMTCFVVLALSFAYPINNIANYKLSLSTLFDDDFAKAKHIQKTYSALHFIQSNIPKNATILSFKNAETAYYAKRKYVYHTDPKLVEFYKAKNLDLAFQQLLSLGIDYIVIPEYPLAYIDQSYLVNIIGSPEYSDLIYQDGPVKIFQLNKIKRSRSKIKIDISNNLPNLKNDHSQKILRLSEKQFYPLSIDLPLEQNQLYQLKFKPIGMGKVSCYLNNSFSSDGEKVNIFNQVLLPDNDREYSFQFISDIESPASLFFTNVIDNHRIKISHFELYKVNSTDNSFIQISALKNRLLQHGWKISDEISKIHYYFFKLKNLLGYHNFKFNHDDIDWLVISKNTHLELAIQPMDSLQYYIDFPTLNPEDKLSSIYFIKGNGYALLRLVAKRSYSQEKPKAIVKEVPINLSSEFKVLNIMSFIQKAFGFNDYHNYSYQIRLTYRKPKTIDQGLVVLKTPMDYST